MTGFWPLSKNICRIRSTCKAQKEKYLRDTIFREIASNMPIHPEYTNATPARLIIEYGQVNT
ncbi:MAG: hypothetical protein ACOC8I_03800 [Desulfosalsimonas sp.]